MIASGRGGPIEFTSEFFIVNVSADQHVRIEFFDNSGLPLNLDLEDLGERNLLEFRLGSGEVFSTSTTGLEKFKIGYVRVTEYLSL